MNHEGKFAHHSYNGWVVECACGWKSDTYRLRSDADAALEIHLSVEAN